MAQKPTGPCESGAGGAFAPSKSSEARPASPRPAVVRDTTAEDVLHWHLRQWPDIESFVWSLAQTLPRVAVHELAEALGDYLRPRQLHFDDHEVGLCLSEWLELTPEPRFQVVSDIMSRHRRERRRLSQIKLQLSQMLCNHGVAEGTSTLNTVRGIVTFVGAAVALSTEPIEDGVGITA